MAARDSVVNDKTSVQHETFGYDFMVDTSFNVWLLEVNSSPSMEYSSPITERMVKQVLYDIEELAMQQAAGDGRNFGTALGQRIGNFELIYNS